MLNNSLALKTNWYYTETTSHSILAFLFVYLVQILVMMYCKVMIVSSIDRSLTPLDGVLTIIDTTR